MPTAYSRRAFGRNVCRTVFALSAAPAALATRLSFAAPGPNEQVTLGVMGVNGRGAALAEAFAEIPSARVAHLADVDQTVLDRVASQCHARGQAVETHRDFRKILDRNDVDALVIAAPDHWHGPATIMACAAGKHVYVEKPAAHNPREGELMVAAAERHKRVVQVGTQRRSSRALAETLGRLSSGEIGRVLFARAWITSNRPNIGHGAQVAPPAHLDYELWQGPAPETPYRDNVVHYQWHWFWNWGTGELGNNGVHWLDLARWGLGVEYPQRVTCGGGKYFFDDDQQTPDTQLATFDFGDRAIQWEHRTWHKGGFEGADSGVLFYGERGTLLVSSHEFKLAEIGGKPLAEGPLDRGQKEHLEDFVTAVRDSHKPKATIEEAVKSTLLCQLGNIAYRSGETVDLDPQTHQLKGNRAQQQALWSREYRPGWEPQV